MAIRVAILSQGHDGRAKCVNAGTCDLGCATGAKASVDLTYWPILEGQGIELRTGCRVREILVNDQGMASGVLYHDEEGQLQEQRAEMVVLACNGVMTHAGHSYSTSEREGIAEIAEVERRSANPLRFRMILTRPETSA